MIDLKQDYFALFELSPDFDIDQAALSSAFRQQQAKVHPDRFANGSEQESRQAMQMTAFVNEAYETLRNPRLRARYLLQLQNIEFDDEREISRDSAYLMEQLELREAIDAVNTIDDPDEALDVLAGVNQQVKQHNQAIEARFRQHYQQGDFEQAKTEAVKMRFSERIKSEVRLLEERIDERL